MSVDGACVACGEPAKHSIELAVGPEAAGDDARYYIPNQFARSSPMGEVHEVPFCGTCIRVVEDNFRATIRYLQHEKDQSPLSIYEYGYKRGK